MNEAHLRETGAIRLPTVRPKQAARPASSRILRRFRSHRLALVGCAIMLTMMIGAVFAPIIAAYDPTKADFASLNQPPSLTHIFGTDGVGRDVFSRILYGAQVSLAVGFLAVAVYITIGVLIGSVAGYFGGWVDNVIMRFTDVMMCFPSFVFTLILVNILGASVFNIVFVIGIFGWTGIARLVRGQVLSLRELDYVLAARSIGSSEGRVLLRHILPNLVGPLIVAATMGIGGAILAEAGLSFLGLGIAKPNPTWGMMLSDARSPAEIAEQPWLWIVPGLAISLAVLAANFIGDGLRDAFDVRSTKTR
jgi:peptide/nickel transport system permease protein